MFQKATVRMVLTALSEGDGGDAAAFVGNLDALAGAEGAAAVDCAGGGGGAAAHGVILLGFGSVCAVRAVRRTAGRKKSFSILAESANRLWRVTPRA